MTTSFAHLVGKRCKVVNCPDASLYSKGVMVIVAPYEEEESYEVEAIPEDRIVDGKHDVNARIAFCVKELEIIPDGFCAECELPFLEDDYICSKCRKNLGC